jgi:hypothetical protein
MNAEFDPLLIAIVLLIWPAARALVFLCASAVSVWARTARRRSAALRLLRLLHGVGEANGGGENE